MHYGIAIIGAIMLLIVLLPFVYMERVHRKRKRKLYQKLEELAGRQQLTIGDWDSWGHSAIGISADHTLVFACRQINGQWQEQTINLNRFCRCQLLNTHRTCVMGKESYQLVEKLELLFETAGGTYERSSVEFYNAAYDSPTLNNEWALAKAWNKRINALQKGSTLST